MLRAFRFFCQTRACAIINAGCLVPGGEANPLASILLKMVRRGYSTRRFQLRFSSDAATSAYVCCFRLSLYPAISICCVRRLASCKLNLYREFINVRSARGQRRHAPAGAAPSHPHPVLFANVAFTCMYDFPKKLRCSTNDVSPRGCTSARHYCWLRTNVQTTPTNVQTSPTKVQGVIGPFSWAAFRGVFSWHAHKCLSAERDRGRACASPHSPPPQMALPCFF